VEVRVAKNRKVLGKRAVLHVPSVWRGMFQEEAETLREFLKEHSSEKHPFSCITNHRMNEEIKVACMKIFGESKGTTYSFRRLYIYDIIELLNCDFSRVCDYTLHFEKRTIRAFYDKTLS